MYVISIIVTPRKELLIIINSTFKIWSHQYKTTQLASDWSRIWTQICLYLDLNF
jgi:hypothetical protein